MHRSVRRSSSPDSETTYALPGTSKAGFLLDCFESAEAGWGYAIEQIVRRHLRSRSVDLLLRATGARNRDSVRSGYQARHIRSEVEIALSNVPRATISSYA